jgi:flagellar hook protein FlgE
VATASSLYTAVSGLDAQQQYMSVIANNLANINTTGFKASQVLFQDALSENLQTAGLGSATSTALSPNSEQIGLGVSTAAVEPNFTQGSLQATGIDTDVAIQGQGFFVVTNQAATAGQVNQPTLTTGFQYTRDGAFQLTPTSSSEAAGDLGFLTTATGEFVVGTKLPLPAAGTPPPLTSIVIYASYPDPNNQGQLTGVSSISIDSTGTVNATLTSGTIVPTYQLTMQNFANPDALSNAGQNLWDATPAAGKTAVTQVGGNIDSFAAAGSSGMGSLSPGYLEESNVDIGTEFSNMIVAQRGLEADAKTISAEDEILQDVIALKR